MFFVAGKSGARQHVSFNWKTGGLFFVVDFHVPFNELFFFLDESMHIFRKVKEYRCVVQTVFASERLQHVNK